MKAKKKLSLSEYVFFFFLQTSIQTAKPCVAIAAVDAKTLAVGYVDVFGIDLIDLSGRVLRQISKALGFSNVFIFYSF